MPPVLKSFGFALALAIAGPATANQDAHVHGEGQVQIAIDGQLIFVALQSPGADIVGFEHAPRSSAEKAAVATALSRLGDPMQIMRFDSAADCHVLQATAGVDSDEDEHDEPDQHAEHEVDGERGHEDHADEAHGSFSAEYEIECTDIGALRSIEFTYFRHFEAAQMLDVVLIDDTRQLQTDLDRDDPVLRLDR